MSYAVKLDNIEVVSSLFDVPINKTVINDMVVQCNTNLLAVLNGPNSVKYQAKLGTNNYAVFTGLVRFGDNIFKYVISDSDIELVGGTYSIQTTRDLKIIIDSCDLEHERAMTDGVIYYRTSAPYRRTVVDCILSGGIQDYITFEYERYITDYKIMNGWFDNFNWFLKDHKGTIFSDWNDLMDKFNRFRIDNNTLCKPSADTVICNSKANLVGLSQTQLSAILDSAKMLIPTTSYKLTTSAKIDVQNYSRMINQIVAVYEFNNTRIFVSVSGHDAQKPYYYHGTPPVSYHQNISVNIIDSSHSLYRYVDVDRRFINKDAEAYHLEHQPLGFVVFTDVNITLPANQVTVQELFNKITKDKLASVKFYDQGILDSEVNKLTHKAEVDKEAIAESETLKKKIDYKISGLSAGTETFKVNGVEFKPDYINYEGQILSINGKLWVGDFLSKLPRSSPADFLENINFDRIREAFINHVTTLISRTDKLDLRVGDITLNLEKKVSEVTKKGSTSTTTSSRIYINEERINTEEVGECIDRALCYSIQKEYNSFLDSVSKCSLRIHGYLQRGIEVSISNPFRGKSINLIFPLTREDGKNFIKIGDIKYRVKDTNKLISVESQTNSEEIIARLTDASVIYDLPREAIIPLFKAAIEMYKVKITRANEFLTQTEKRFGLVKKQVTLDNGTSLMGYIVNGTIRDYFVESNGGYDVYSYPQGKHICMVDKSIVQTGVDKLIGRLYALKNDAVVAQHINTLEE